jgi:hypothetical protein
MKFPRSVPGYRRKDKRKRSRDNRQELTIFNLREKAKEYRQTCTWKCFYECKLMEFLGNSLTIVLRGSIRLNRKSNRSKDLHLAEMIITMPHGEVKT